MYMPIFDTMKFKSTNETATFGVSYVKNIKITDGTIKRIK